MKKLITLLLALTMLLAIFSGCAGETATEEAAEAPAAEETTEEASEPAAEEAAEAPAEDEDMEVYEMEDAEAIEAAKSGSIDFAAHKALCESLTADFPVAEGETISVWLSYETSSLQYVEDSDMQNILCYRLLEELTGVHLDMTIADMTTSSEKFNIMVASGDYPDLIPGSSYTTGVDAAIDDEVIIDATDLIAEYCPNLTKLMDSSESLAKEVKTTEGRIGSFPRIKDGVTTPGNAGAFMRMDWLETLGMDVPTTYDELEEVLLAFKSEFGASEALMLGDTILPQGGNLTAGYDFIATVTSGNGGGASSGFFQKDGQVVYGATCEELREFTEMLNRWYTEGLINEKCLTRATNPFSSDITDPVLNGDTGMFYSNQPFGDNYNAMDETGTINFYPVQDVGKTSGQPLHFYENITLKADGDLSISTDCRDEVLCAKYLDSLYSYECYLIINYGEQGVSWDYDADGVPQFLQSGLDQYTSTNIATAVWTTQSLPCIYAESRLAFTFKEGAAAAFEVWGTNKDNSYSLPSDFSLTTEESEAITTIYTDILTFVSEHYWKFVTGEENLESDWDSYVATIESMGLSTVYDTIQTAYERVA